MLKRIAVIAENGVDSAELEAALNDVNCQCVSVTSGGALPPATAVAVGSGAVGAIVAAAQALGDRQEALLRLLATAIDCREFYPPGDSLRVMEHASRFATALGLSADERLALERGALLRDIGKLDIPNEVLLKQDLLSYEDWQFVRRHTHIGGDMVRHIDGLQDIEPVCRYHHESFDGEGYPDGLKEDDIPLLARIVKIVDVYCAMTCYRFYREGHVTPEEALAHIKKERGGHFDPELVDVFLGKNVARI
ncbi:MAG: HD domain-containing phosphohydrolase [Candidatus Hydrogenedentales bacterium]